METWVLSNPNLFRLGSGANSVSVSSSSLGPPPGLYLPQGPIQVAWRTECPRSGAPSKGSASQKAGLAYQRKIGRFLRAPDWPGWKVVDGPWFAFADDSPRRHYCQPDFIVEMGDLALVIEVKLRWTPAAWWQLRKLYLPVLARARSGVALIPLCITRSFDPAEGTPEEPWFCADLFDARPDRFNVLVVK